MAKPDILEAIAELINSVEWMEQVNSVTKLEKSLLVTSAEKALEIAENLTVEEADE